LSARSTKSWTFERRRAKHGREDVREPRDRWVFHDVLRAHPPSLDVLPIQRDPSGRYVEEERMDREHGGLVAGADDGPAGGELRHAEPRLLPDLLAGAPQRRLGAFEEPGDSRPLSAEGPDPVPPLDDEDPPTVSEERGDDGPLRDLRQVHGPRISVHGHAVPRDEDRDLDPIDERDPAKDRARRDDRLRPLVHDRGGAVSPLREPVHDVRPHGAPFPMGEREDPPRHLLLADVGGGIEHDARPGVDAAEE
jgi:hypothetical protein